MIEYLLAFLAGLILYTWGYRDGRRMMEQRWQDWQEWRDGIGKYGRD